MKSFQLDECMDQKRLVRSCAEEGLVQVARFPAELKTAEARRSGTQKDSYVLQRFLSRDSAFLTSDRPIVEANPGFVPDRHCGIIILSNSKPTPTPSGKDFQKVLETFKLLVPDWHSLPWDNSIVTMTQDWIEVCHLENGSSQKDAFLFLSDPELPGQLHYHLTNNAHRSPHETDQSNKLIESRTGHRPSDSSG